MTEITINSNVSINGMTYEDIRKFMENQQKILLSVMSKDKWMTCEEILAAYHKNAGSYYTTGAGIASALSYGGAVHHKTERKMAKTHYYTCLCDKSGNPIGEPVKHERCKVMYRLR